MPQRALRHLKILSDVSGINSDGNYGDKCMTGIVLDIDDTLYDRQKLISDAAGEVLGITFDEQQRRRFVDEFYRCSDSNLARLERGEITTVESNSWRYGTVMEMFGLGDINAGHRAAELYLSMQSSMAVSPLLSATLDRISVIDDVILGIITAGQAGHQWSKFDRLGLDRWVDRDRTIVAGEVGYTKPDVRIFEMMEDRLGLTPENLWMVGDSMKHDIIGAAGARWHTIWFDRRGSSSDISGVSYRPDFTVHSEEELCDALCSVCVTNIPLT